ncbi:MAG: hypothetical protein ACLRSW_10435 [Christensenellaceae bacterium]
MSAVKGFCKIDRRGTLSGGRGIRTRENVLRLSVGDEVILLDNSGKNIRQ